MIPIPRHETFGEIRKSVLPPKNSCLTRYAQFDGSPQGVWTYHLGNISSGWVSWSYAGDDLIFQRSTPLEGRNLAGKPQHSQPTRLPQFSADDEHETKSDNLLKGRAFSWLICMAPSPISWLLTFIRGKTEVPTNSPTSYFGYAREKWHFACTVCMQICNMKKYVPTKF